MVGDIMCLQFSNGPEVNIAFVAEVVVNVSVMLVQCALRSELAIAVAAANSVNVPVMLNQSTLRSEFTAADTAPNFVDGLVVLLTSLIIHEVSVAGTAEWTIFLTIVLIKLRGGIKIVIAIIAFPKSVVVLGVAVLADGVFIAEEPFAFVALIVHGEGS
jgi:hypothetical protein